MHLRRLAAVLPLAPVLLLACEGDSEKATLEAPGTLVAPFRCATDPIQQEPRHEEVAFERLRAGAGLDWLSWIRARDAGAAGDDVAASVGERCATASDRDACASAVAALTSDTALYPSSYESDHTFGSGVKGYWLAYTKGDTVGKIASVAELRALFPAIDAPEKALLHALAGGYRVECHGAGWVREETDGWVLRASRGHQQRCTRADVLLLVRRDGTTTELDAREDQKDRCT